MAITFVCPCGKRLRVRDEHASRRIACAGCGCPVTVPEFDSPVSESKNGPTPVIDHPPMEIPNIEPIGPIYFRPHPTLGDPNRVASGKWVPLDDKQRLPTPPPELKRRRKRRPVRQIAWRRETKWFECLFYPFRAWPLVLGLGIGLGMFAGHAATDLPQLSDRLEDGNANGTALILLLGFGTLCYTIGFLDCVLGSAAAGEYRYVRWPERSALLVMRGCLTWLLCFLAGPALFAVAAVAYWLHNGDPDLGDQLIVGELSAVAAGYWLLALLAATESRRVIAGPQAVAALFRRLGVGSCGALLAALTLAFFLGRFAVNSLEEYHRSWFFGGFLLGCAGIAGVYLAVFFLRYLGMRAFHTRPAAIADRPA